MCVQPKPGSGQGSGPVAAGAQWTGTAVVTRWVRRVTVLVVVLGMGLLCAPGALAGGQTSVLVTSPSSSEAAALYASDARYHRLEALLGPPGRGVRERPPSLDSSTGTRQINVAWMALDLTPARIDRVFPGDDPDTIWIHTAAETPATYRGLWHRAVRPADLAALIEELGLMGPPNTDGAGAALFPRPWEKEGTGALGAPLPVLPVETATAFSASASGPGDTGAYELLHHWWWVIPGFAAGTALTFAALRFPGVWGKRERGRRQQLF